MMLKWLHFLAAAISGKTDKRLDTATLVTMNEGHRDSGELIEPQASASNVNRLDELERMLRERPLEELERAFSGSLLAAFNLGIASL
jgi:hypothetical protein